MSNYGFNVKPDHIKNHPKFIVTPRTSYRGTEYDLIEWGDWMVDVYKNGGCKLVYEFGDGYTPLKKDEIPTLIALLIMIYTRSYK